MKATPSSSTASVGPNDTLQRSGITGRHLAHAGKLVLGAVLIVIVLRKVDGTELSRLLLGANFSMLLAATMVLGLATLVNAHRWVLVSRRIGHPISPKAAAIGYFESMFFNQILPTSVGGDVARVVRAVDAGIVYGWAIIGVLIDRALGILGIALALVGAYLLSASAAIESPTFLVVGLAAVAILLGALATALAGRWLRPTWLPNWAGGLLALANAFYRTVGSRALPVLLINMALTIGLTLASFMLCARAVGVSLGGGDAMIVLGGMLLASVIPASIGGWGLREGAALLLFAPLGVDAGQATAIAVLFGLSITGLGLVGAIVWMAAGYGGGLRLPLKRPNPS